MATDDKGASIESGGIGARITYRPYSVSLKLGPAELQADRISVDVGSRPVSLPTGFSLLEDGTTAAHLSFLAAADEHFFGLGERFLDFDRRGQRCCCWNFDALGCSDDASYKNVPFFISSKHYAVFTDTTAAAYFDFCRAVQGSWSVVICDDTADLYFFGGNPRSCLAQYQETVGGAFLPPAWAFGIWMSGGFEADSADSVRQRLSELRRRGFPCDVVHIDTYWQKYGRWSDLAWNEEAFAHLEELLAEIHKSGAKVCLWINPYIGIESPLFREADEAGYLLRRPDGSSWRGLLWGDYHPPVGVVDLTNPAAVE